MGYGFNLNNRLIVSLIDSCAQVKQPLKNNGLDLIRKTLDKEMTPLDKFYVFINPTQESAQFRWTDRQIAKATEGFHGKAKELIEKNFDQIQKKMNQQMIAESHHQFNSIESILDFAHNNEELLDLLTKDPEFHLHFSEKLHQMITVAETREKTLDVSDRFFSKLSNAVQAQGWQTQAERAKEIRSELHNRMTGNWSAEEVRAIFKRKEQLKSFEEMRLYLNLRNITHHDGDVNKEDIGLDSYLENGVKSPIILELETYYKAMWQGIYERRGFSDNVGIVPSDRKFFTFYESLNRHFMDNIELRDICLRAILENASGKEIDQFLTCFNRLMYNRWTTTSDDLQIEQQILRAIPLQKYLSYKKEMCGPNVGSNSQEARIAALLFVESIKANDLAGISFAKGIINHYIYVENLRSETRFARKRVIRNNANKEPINMPIFHDGEKMFANHVREFLKPEEIAIFLDSYGELHQESTPPIAFTSEISSPDPISMPANKGVEFFTKSPSLVLLTLAGNHIDLKNQILNPYDARFKEFSYINDLSDHDKIRALNVVSDQIHTRILEENKNISPESILKLVEQSFDSLISYQNSLPDEETTLRLKVFIQIALHKFEETTALPNMLSYYRKSKELLAQFEKTNQVADDSALLHHFQNDIDVTAMYNRTPLPVDIQNAFKSMTAERLNSLLNQNILNLAKWSDVAHTTLSGDIKTVLVEYLCDLLPTQDLKNQFLDNVFTILSPEEVTSLIFWLVRPELSYMMKAIEEKTINVSVIVDKILEYHKNSNENEMLNLMLKDSSRNKLRPILGNMLYEYVNHAESETENYHIAKALINKYSLQFAGPLSDDQLDDLMADMGPWEPPVSPPKEPSDLERELNLRLSLLQAPEPPKEKLPIPKKTKNPKIQNK